MGTMFKDIETNENNMAIVILLISVLVIIITYELFYSIWEHFIWLIYLLDNLSFKNPQKAIFHYLNSFSLKKSLNLVVKLLQSCKDCCEIKSGYIKTNNVCYTYITNEFLMVYLTIKLLLSTGQFKEHPKVTCFFSIFLLIASKFKDLCMSY